MDEYILKELLNKKGYTLSSAESLTGGGFSYFITKHPGASSYFKGGLVTYVNDVKAKLGVSQDTLDKFGAVSKQCAEEMAIKAKSFFNTEVAISFTGNAGPSALEGKPVGLVYIGISILDKTFVYENVFVGDREEIRNRCISFGVDQLQKLLK